MPQFHYLGNWPGASSRSAVGVAADGTSLHITQKRWLPTAGWSITWDLTTQLQSTDGEALFTATSPSNPTAPSVIPFEAVFDGETNKVQDPNIINEFVARVADTDGVVTVTSPGGPADADVERLRFSAASADAEVTRIDFTLQGTNSAADFTAFKLYTDAD